MEKSLKHLKIKEKAISTACYIAIMRLRYPNVEDMHQALENKMKIENLVIENEYEPIKQLLSEFIESVTCKDKIKRLDIEYYKEHAKELYSRLINFKTLINNKMKVLKENEASMLNEMILLENLCKSNNTTTKKIKMKMEKSRPHTSKLSQEVENFEKFLRQTGGHTGGWGEEEHKIFLKFWHKYNRNSTMELNLHIDDIIEGVQNILTEKSSQDIFLHIKWMNKYNELKNLKKSALHNWKVEHEADKYVRKYEIYLNAENSKTQHYYENIKLKKEELNQWKISKIESRNSESQKLADTVIIKKESDCFKDRNRRIERKMIFEWINTKHREFDRIESQNEEREMKMKEMRSAKANKKIKEFRKRDETYLQERLEKMKKHKESKARPTNKILKKNPVKYTYTGQQYTKLTKSCLYRILDKKEKRETIMPINGLDYIPKLATPQWRIGLSLR